MKYIEKEVKRMRKFWVILIAVAMAAAVLLVGCSKKNGTGASPSPSASQSASSTPAGTAMSSPGASASGSPSASPGGEAGNTGTATKAPEPIPTITNEQLKKLDVNSTYADFEKIVGKTLKPIKEEGGKKTYEVKIANETNKYMDITFFSDGKFSQQQVFLK
jgi:cytoskeletal protein RodZ